MGALGRFGVRPGLGLGGVFGSRPGLGVRRELFVVGDRGCCRLVLQRPGSVLGGLAGVVGLGGVFGLLARGFLGLESLGLGAGGGLTLLAGDVLGLRALAVSRAGELGVVGGGLFSGQACLRRLLGGELG